MAGVPCRCRWVILVSCHCRVIVPWPLRCPVALSWVSARWVCRLKGGRDGGDLSPSVGGGYSWLVAVRGHSWPVVVRGLWYLWWVFAIGAGGLVSSSLVVGSWQHGHRRL